MCPKEDPNYMAMWIVLLIGGILFGCVMTYLITWAKKRRLERIRNTHIDNSMVPILPAGVVTEDSAI